MFIALHLLDAGDLNATDGPIHIPIGESAVCFSLEAVDDDIVEDEEMFNLIITPLNLNDLVDGNTTIVILDNDCKNTP